MNKNFSKFKIAVVGATGNVGRTILNILADKNFPAQNIFAIASKRSAGKQISYGENAVLTIHSLSNFNFTQTQIALFSPGAKISSEYAPRAAEAGCIVIDNTSHFRMDKDVPLIIPEVNLDALKDFRKKNIIANPNCSTIQLLMALKPMHDLNPVKRVVTSTYQSVSGAGKEGMDELYNQTKSIFVNQSLLPQKFHKPIAFNVIPQIDVFMDDHYTKEEWKMAVETKKILDKGIALTATCVRVPVFIGHALTANIEFFNPLDINIMIKKLKTFKGVKVIDNPQDYLYMTPIECAGEEDVYISRIRRDHTVENGLAVWIAADNVRKGAALNAIQIAECLMNDYL